MANTTTSDLRALVRDAQQDSTHAQAQSQRGEGVDAQVLLARLQEVTAALAAALPETEPAPESTGQTEPPEEDRLRRVSLADDTCVGCGAKISAWSRYTGLGWWGDGSWGHLIPGTESWHGPHTPEADEYAKQADKARSYGATVTDVPVAAGAGAQA